MCIKKMSNRKTEEKKDTRRGGGSRKEREQLYQKMRSLEKRDMTCEMHDVMNHMALNKAGRSGRE